ncbi:MAG TPA: D-alanyl-D-alanine carboxypeptidase [Candidatus Melainabacteria bacterium]|nr:D-alanyl-D-alanine carboxypeptidase [Candidatus Melainabacteria bacterium]
MRENGQVVLDELSNVEFNPASVSKLVTAYGAIKTFGIEHHFRTSLLTDGQLDSETGVLNGNLYVRGADPDFRRQDALSLNQALYDAGVRKIKGQVIVNNQFSYGTSQDPAWSGKYLTRVWSVIHKIPVTGGVAVGEVPTVATELGSHDSETLRDTLKEMLCYSQNNVAEQIGRVSGGVSKLAEIVGKEANIDPSSIKLATASGLGKGRIKPKDMMTILRSLRGELQSYGLDLQDICPVAGVDRGTLDERFTGSAEKGSVVGKTGSLPGTDGGTSTLVGMFRSQKEDFYFVIFCWKGNVYNFRHQQDELIRKYQAANGGPKPFIYNLAQSSL